MTTNHSKPAYDLDVIKEIARSKPGNIDMEKRAFTSARNYGYFEEEIARCITRLTSSDYYKTITYEDYKVKGLILNFDVYKKVKCPNSDNTDMEMYIKLRVSGGSWLYVSSFKPEGAI